MKVSKKFKRKLKSRILVSMSSITVACMLLAVGKIAGFSMPFEHFMRVGNSIQITDVESNITDGKIEDVVNINKELEEVTSSETTSETYSGGGITIADDGAIVCDSIVQGVKDCNLEDGDYIFRVHAQTAGGVDETIDYSVELINYYDDVTYSLGENQTAKTVSLGDNSKNYKMLVVKYHKNLTINKGVTLTATTVSSLTYKKGMYLCVLGNMVNNGTISMTARGTNNLAGQNVYLWKNADSTFEYIPAIGGTGGASVKDTKGRAGTAGKGRQTGGGGSGGAEYAGTTGAGGKGTSYSGGSGGGAAYSGTGAIGSSKGGAGGKGVGSQTGGGAGNPGGAGGSAGAKGSNGTGGLLVIYADNYINNGSITSKGSNGGNTRSGGGSSGGGSINLFINNDTGIDQLGIITDTRYREILKSVSVTGGSASGTHASYKGGAGGAGTINIGEIRDGQYYDLKEVIEQDKEAFIEQSNKRGESILKIVEENEFKTGYYTFKVNEQEYPVHLIAYDGDQYWEQDQIFGDALDVATSTSDAQNMVIVKVNGNVTIKEGVKVTTYSDTNYGGPKGFLLYTTGTLTNNGEITMTAKGARAKGQDVYLWKNTDGTYEYVPAEGGTGGTSISSSTGIIGESGTKGKGRQTGGGGSGGAEYAGTTGAGGTGTSYSGGSGGGAAYSGTGTAGSSIGGAGGTGVGSQTGGGAGNPGGAGGSSGAKGSNGTGGLLIIYADNYINNGRITSKGSNGGNARSGGGSSGGGSINIFANIITEKGTTDVNGGSASGTHASYKGGEGGTGTVTINELTTMSSNAETEKVEGTYTIDGISTTKEAVQKEEDIYVLEVQGIVGEVEITITAEDKNAMIIRGSEEGQGILKSSVTLEGKETIINYQIIAENKTVTKTKTVKIIKLSSEARLARLEVNGKVVVADSNGVYQVSVEGGTTQVPVKATATNSGATVAISKNASPASGKAVLNATLSVPEIENSYIINITAEDGTTRQYVLKISKQTNIDGKIITENIEGKHKAMVTVYKTSDTNPEAREDNNASNDNNDSSTLNDETLNSEVSNSGISTTNTRKIIVRQETKEDGSFIVEVKDIEPYDIVISKLGYLDYRITDIEVEQGEKTQLETYNLMAGDVVKTGQIEIDDLVAINENFGVVITEENQAEKAIYDLNEDGKVDILDRDILKKNYGKKNDIEHWEDPRRIRRMRTRRVETLPENPQNFILPIKGNYTITLEYGSRIHPVTGEEKKHTGIDLGGEHRTEIYAVAEGEVVFAGVQNAFGNCIEIKHEVNGEVIYSFYAHLSRIDVTVGQEVKQGEVIGLEGGDPETDPNPGSSTGHHLHFELRSASGYGNDVDPRDYMEF